MTAKTVAHKEDKIDDAEAPAKKATKKGEKIVLADKEGVVVATVDVPAHQAEVSLASSSIEGLALAAANAWDKVKADDDASFATASGSFRQHLINTAEETFNSGHTVTHEGTTQRLFEDEILKFKAA